VYPVIKICLDPCTSRPIQSLSQTNHWKRIPFHS